jgi:hypothetical protein
MEFTSKQTKDYDSDFTGSDLETGIRLNEEYQKGQLKLDIRNGVMDVKIGDFNIQVDFAQENVPVT